jgi:ribosome biogenesis protein NSA1
MDTKVWLGRNLRCSFRYLSFLGISGAVVSISPSPTVLASVALDRYSRIHSTFPPPLQAGQRQEQKGKVLDKVYVKSTPTVVVWDQSAEVIERTKATEEDEDIWNEMEDVEDRGDEQSSRRKKQRMAA